MSANDSPPASPKEEKSEEVSRCLVYCRMRPSKPADFEDGAFQLLQLQGKRVSVKDERNYDFDGTYDVDCRQEDLFDGLAKPCIEHTFKGFNTALLAYGQTGSGKSFSMLGNVTHPQLKGLMPRSADYIFEKIASDTSRRYSVSASFVQIYRDKLGDLMTEGGKENVDIRFDDKEGVTLPGATVTKVTSAEEFMECFMEADKRRVVTATLMNPESSRGHTAIIVRINSEPADEADCGARISGKITFIDLAGYERFSKTGISNSNPIMKDEAKTINASLLSLGHVVTALSNGDKHIPWRNAKLTRLLQDSIGGRSRTTMLLTVGPSSEHLHESTNTLQFGQRAMAVKVQAKVSSSVDYEKLAAKLQELLNEKDKQISSLEIKLAESNAEREELLQRHGRDEDDLRARQHQQLATLKEEGASAEKILEVTQLFEVEIENLKEQQREELSYQQESAEQEMKELLEEQAKLTRRKEDEAKMREESRLKELEEKLAQARGGDSTADLERCLKQLAERDAVLVSRAGERARLQALCATLIQQVRQLGGTPTHGGEFEENFLDVIQVEEIREMLEVQITSLQNQSSDLRAQLAKIQEVATNRAVEVEDLKDEIEKLQMERENLENVLTSMNNEKVESYEKSPKQDDVGEDSNAAAAEEEEKKQEDEATSSTPAGVPKLSLGGLGNNNNNNNNNMNLDSTQSHHHQAPLATARGNSNLVDKSEVDTVRTLMQIDIDMLNCKVKMLESQLAQANADLDSFSVQNNNNNKEPVSPGHPNNQNGEVVPPPANQSFTSTNETSSNPPLTARSGRRRAGTIRLGEAPSPSSNNQNQNEGNQQQQQQQQQQPETLADYRKEVNDLRNKNLGFESANVALHQHVKHLEAMVNELGGNAPEAPPQQETATIENVIKTAHDLSKAKSEELERLLSLLDAREAVINDQAMQIGTLSEDSRRIREQYPQIMREQSSDSAASGSSNVQHQQQQHSQQIKQFVELIRAARSAQRSAEEKLFALQNKTAALKLNTIISNDEVGGDGTSLLPPQSGDNNNHNQQQHQHVDPNNNNNILNIAETEEELSSFIRRNDDKLLEAESKVIELESQNAALKRMVAALEKQLELASMTPVCGLSKEDREFVDLEREKDDSQARAAQDELQQQLQAQLEEKQKIQHMLDDMSKKRAQEAAVYSSMENQLEEQKAEIQKKVEEDKKASADEMMKLQKVADEHAAEARRLKQMLDERERKEREAAEEAARVKKQLEEFEKAQKAREEEAARLKAELEEKQKASSEAQSEEAAKLKKQLEENTREMMAAQARKQLEELEGEQKKSSPGFFDKIRNWKI